jgi:hypothetical protein
MKKEGERQEQEQDEGQGGQGGEDGVVGETQGKTSSEPRKSGPTAKPQSQAKARSRTRSGTGASAGASAGAGADAVIICGGTLRGDSQYGPGKITLGDILGAYDVRMVFTVVLSRFSPPFPFVRR